MLKLFRSKIFIGAMFLLMAGALAFVLLPKLYSTQASTVEIVELKQTAEYGTVITDDMLIATEIGAYGLPDNIIKDKSEVVGLVADSTIYAGEYLWRDRFITAEAYQKATSKAGLGLSDGTYLLTISFPTASSGLAGILRAGDVVDVYGYTDDNGNVAVNEALTAVTVYKVLNSKLVSLNDLDAELEDNPDTDPSDYDFTPAYVVFTTNEQQAKVLIELEKEKSLHLTLREAGA
ncbi:MAG: RcpC/CpaB family pilus assembly protein [Oscillospiraceae bacterium]|nr:RcpC/CpaB family pilus assembly protein [Oscillospiraceae bacterium]